MITSAALRSGAESIREKLECRRNSYVEQSAEERSVEEWSLEERSVEEPSIQESGGGGGDGRGGEVEASAERPESASRICFWLRGGTFLRMF